MKHKHPGSYNPNIIEGGIKKYWNSRDIKRIVLTDKRVGGSKHHIIHTPHILDDTFNVADIYPKLLYDIWYRFQYMNGHNIRAPYGYDTYSLSVEKKALSDLEKEDFKQLDKDSMDEFIRSCQRIALEDKEFVEREYKNLAFLYDPKKFYSSYPSTYIDSCWWTVKSLFEKGMIEKRKALLPYCENCRTSLTKIDRVGLNKIEYESLLKYPTKKGADRSFLVHMEHPWKLLGTVALMVHPDEEYSVVEYETSDKPIKTVLQKKLVKKVMEDAAIYDYRILNSVKGESLEGFDFVNPLCETPLFNENNDHTFKIIASEKTPETTTGLFPLAPGLDKISSELGKAYGFYDIHILTKDRRIADLKNLVDYAGTKVEDLDEEIIEQMRVEGIFFSYIEKYSTVDSCTYCETPYTHKEDEQWFLNSKGVVNKRTRMYESIELFPDWMGSSKDDKWLSNFEDPFITRRDGWGMPFPLWQCRCGERFIPETVEELISAASRRRRDSNIMSVLRDIRDIKIPCQGCEDEMSWEGKIINSLALASMSPWAQVGYPKKHIEGWWPGDVMFGSIRDSQGIFNTHLTISASLFDSPPVEKWVGHGNTKFFFDDLEEFVRKTGKDTFRMGLINGRQTWDNMDIFSDTFKESDKMISVLWNVFTFFMKESSKRDFNPEETHLEFLKEYMCVEDRWLISRLENLNREVKIAYPKMRFDTVVELVKTFVLDDMAQWYIYLARKRLEEGKQKDVLSVLKVLHESLVNVAKMIAPIVPHISERIYLDLEGKEPSVLLSSWPLTNRLFIDEFIEDEMEEVKRIVDGILRGKRKEHIPEKWPLKRIVVDAEDGVITALVDKYEKIIMTKAKVNKIEVVPAGEEWEEMILEVHPNYNAIGKAYRQWVSRIALMLEKRPAKEIKVGIDRGEYKLGIEGGIVEIQPNMVTFERELPMGFSEVKTNHGGIYLDREIDPKIWFEQIAKEIVLRLKSMRIDMDLKKDDELEVFIDASDDVNRAVEKYKDMIREEVRAREIFFGEDEIEEAEYLVEWNMAGQVVDLLQVYGMTERRHEWEVTGQTIDIGIIPLYKSKIIDLYQSIPGMNRSLGERLYEYGYTSIRTLRNATAAEISSIEGFKRSLGRRIVQVVKQRGDEFEARIEGRLDEAEEYARQEKYKKQLLGTLQRVEGIGPARAESIYEAGFKYHTDIICSDIEDLTEVSHISPELAKKIIDAVTEQYGPIKEELPSDKIRCDGCGAVLTKHAERCYSCGAEVVGELPEKVTEDVEDMLEYFEEEEVEDEEVIDDIQKAIIVEDKDEFDEYVEKEILKENPEEEVPEEEVPEEEVPEEEVPEEEVPEEEVPEEEVPEEEVPEDEVPEDEVPQEEVPEDEVPEDEVPQEEVPEDEVPEDEVPEDEVPEDEVPEDELDEHIEEEILDEKDEFDDYVDKEILTDKDDTEEKDEVDEYIEKEILDDEEEEEEYDEYMLPDGIMKGSSYIIMEKEEDRSIKLFSEIVDLGMKGFLVTRTYPEKVKMRYGFEDISMVWLNNVDKPGAVRPKNLEQFNLNIEQFLKDERGVVLLNGVEYLISNNDFRSVLHLIQALRDLVSINNGVLLMPVSPKTLEKSQLDMLKSELEELENK